MHMDELSAAIVIAVHRKCLPGPESDPRILSEASLHQIVFQAALIPDVVPRAAFVFFSFCAFPPFREANTETGIALAQEILSSAGHSLPEDVSGMMAIANGIRAFTTEPEDVEDWFRKHVKKPGSLPM